MALFDDTARTKTTTVLLACASSTLLLVLTQSHFAPVFLATDGLTAMLLIGSAALAGTWFVPQRYAARLPLRWHLLIGAGAGIGSLSTLVLVLGLAGLLDRPIWIVIVAATTVAAAGAAMRLIRRYRRAPTVPARRPGMWLWLAVTPCVALAILVSVIPPGFLWREEGNGYDVLEYHLELPKEYFEQGRIVFTPHNVYGSFPANVEMLYLLCMVVQGDVYAGAAVAKWVNTLLAALTVFAAYVAGRESSDRAGVFTAVLCAGVGWLTYLCGVAYVENGMLMFAMIAAAALLRAMNDATTDAGRYRWACFAGLMSGLACGCKYSAVLLIATPLALWVFAMPWNRHGNRLGAAALFLSMTVAGFAPWLIKNVAMTGNPVFPLANSVFHACPPGWGERESRHFAASHEPDPENATIARRLRLFWRRIPADHAQRFGPLIFVLAAVRLLSRHRTRTDTALGATLLMQVLGWTFATHLYARFAVPMLVPLVLLAGRSGAGCPTARGRRLLIGVTLLGLAFNAVMSARLYVSHLYTNGDRLPLEGADAYFLDGMVSGHEHLAVINRDLRADSRILMIGDAKAFYMRRPVDYCVVFNRNPFVEVVRAASTPAAVIDWLRRRHYTHVLVNWAEIARLRSSRYGFPETVNPALFERLVRAGLVRTNVFTTGEPAVPYAVLYRVPPAEHP